MTPTLQERIGVNEVEIDHLEEKLDTLRQDVHDMKVDIHAKLTEMQEASTKQHGELAAKISGLEKIKDRWIAMALAGLFVFEIINKNWEVVSHLLGK